MHHDYRILFTSWSATVLAAAVLAGLAVSILPECALRPGMRVLTEADGFGRLQEFGIGIMRGHTKPSAIVDALAQHIVESLDNLSMPTPVSITQASAPILANQRLRQVRATELVPGW